MATLLAVLVLFVIILAVVAALLKGKRGGPDVAAAKGEYELRESVFTPAERSFAGVLDGALPDDVTWFAKVRLRDESDAPARFEVRVFYEMPKGEAGPKAVVAAELAYTDAKLYRYRLVRDSTP